MFIPTRRPMMKKLAEFLVKFRNIILGIFTLLAVVGVFLMQRVSVNNDMTKYLPDSSQMSQGIDVMNEVFGEEQSKQSVIRLMFTDLTDEEKISFSNKLSGIKGVALVDYKIDSEYRNKDNYTLYVLRTNSAKDNASVIKEIEKQYSDYKFVYSTDEAKSSLPLPIIITALAVVLVIMLVMSGSWIEPFIFLVAIGVAIILNMGTNAFLPSVSGPTAGIGAILQLVLSMDYSIILSNRYRQACKKTDDHIQAMKDAVAVSLSSVFSSALTTIVGLLALVFMSFKIGADLGIVIAKGVFFSLICVFTVLPALMILLDKLVEKTNKKPLTIPVKGLAKFSYKARFVILPLFVVIFTGAFIGKNYAGIAYDAVMEDDINKIFPDESQVVVLYSNDEEEKISDLVKKYEAIDGIIGVNAYANTLGIKYTVSELAAQVSQMGVDEALLKTVYEMKQCEAMTFEELMDTFLNSEELLGYLTKEQKTMLTIAKASIKSGAANFVGEGYSRVIIITNVVPGSSEIINIAKKIEELGDSTLSGKHYYIGNSVMSYEMKQNFGKELNKITIITAIAIFVVIAFTFRSFIIPLILVLIIQGSVYLTMSVMGIVKYDMVYLALLIMQCILMGATVDYAIVFTNYYREKRETSDVKESLGRALQSSIRTISTSGLIMAFATGILGFTYNDVTVSPICKIISLGVISAMILIVFFLPSLLAIFDKLIIKKK